MTFWVAGWLRAFGLTLFIELPIAVPLLAPAEPRLGRRAAAVVLANLATHPLVWFLFPGLALSRGTRVGLSEAWAFLAELAIYRIVWPNLSVRRSAITALCANAASFALGLILGSAILAA